jgi:hypothetical protein
MKVFISWSGERSKAVAEALGDWLPKVIQAVRPFVSTNSIDKGTRWRDVLSNELEQSRFSIICLTPENLTAPWILFEAGALSKEQQDKVCTYLFGLEFTDIGDPLSQFQATKAEKDQTRELARTINKVCGDSSLSETDFDETFEVWWPKLEQKFFQVQKPQTAKDPKRSDRELLEDILTTIRTMQQERELKSQISDYILFQYIHFLKSAAQYDPKLSTLPEYQKMLNDIEGRLVSPSFYVSFKKSDSRSKYLKDLAWSLSKESQFEAKEEKNKTETNSNSEDSNS